MGGRKQINGLVENYAKWKFGLEIKFLQISFNLANRLVNIRKIVLSFFVYLEV